MTDYLPIVDDLVPPTADVERWRHQSKVVFHRRIRVNDLSVPDGGFHIVPFGTLSARNDIGDIAWDDDADEFTVAIGGYYVVGASTSWESDPNGSRRVAIQINGTAVAFVGSAAAGSAGPQAVVHDLLNPGDVIHVDVAQTSGGPLDLLPSARTWVSVTRLVAM